MKWFKHQTDELNCPRIARLKSEYGIEGYGRWIIIQLCIASQMDQTDLCSVSLPVEKWASLLGGKTTKIVSFLFHLENIFEIKLEQNGNILKITYPKLLETRDNYSKNLQANCKRLTSKIQIQNKNTPLPPKVAKDGGNGNGHCDGFTEFWGSYPRKESKPFALRAWKAQRAESCLPAILADIASRRDDWLSRGKQYIPLPASYLNARRWEDEATQPLLQVIPQCSTCHGQPYFDAAKRKTPCPKCGVHR